MFGCRQRTRDADLIRAGMQADDRGRHLVFPFPQVISLVRRHGLGHQSTLVPRMETDAPNVAPTQIDFLRAGAF